MNYSFCTFAWLVVYGLAGDAYSASFTVLSGCVVAWFVGMLLGGF